MHWYIACDVSLSLTLLNVTSATEYFFLKKIVASFYLTSLTFFGEL